MPTFTITGSDARRLAALLPLAKLAAKRAGSPHANVCVERDAGDDTVTFTTTDTCVLLTACVTDYNSADKCTDPVLLPAAALAAVAAHKGDDDVTIGTTLDGSKVIVTTATSTSTHATGDGTYPAWRNLLGGDPAPLGDGFGIAAKYVSLIGTAALAWAKPGRDEGAVRYTETGSGKPVHVTFYVDSGTAGLSGLVMPRRVNGAA